MDGLSRRERKRREVRDRLYHAAVELFAEQGYEATTMDAIAERADVARATAFNYFAAKVSFLEEWGNRRRAHVHRVFAAHHVDDESATAQLSRYLDELARLNLASREQTKVLMDASWRFGAVLQDPSLGTQLAQIIEAGVGAGEFRPDLDTAQVGTVLAAGYFATVLRWTSAEPPPFSLSEQLARTLNIVLHGMLTGQPESSE